MKKQTNVTDRIKLVCISDWLPIENRRFINMVSRDIEYADSFVLKSGHIYRMSSFTQVGELSEFLPEYITHYYANADKSRRMFIEMNAGNTLVRVYVPVGHPLLKNSYIRVRETNSKNNID